MTVDEQRGRSKPQEYRNVRPRVACALYWLNEQVPLKGKRILDLGTRDGWAVEYLDKKYMAKARGIELIPEVADYARARGRDVCCDDMEALGERENSFDLVMALHSFEHIQRPVCALEEMTRISRELIYIVVPEQRPSKKKQPIHNLFFPTMSHFCMWLSVFLPEEWKIHAVERKLLFNGCGSADPELRVLMQKK